MNGYVQSVLVNTSAGASASSDFIVGNNQTTATTFFGDFGMNSSNFTGAGSLNLPGAVYLYGANADLVLGTTTANAIHIVAAGATTDAITVTTTNVAQLNSAALGTRSAAPSSPVLGQIYWDTTLGYPRIWNGSSWNGLLLS